MDTLHIVPKEFFDFRDDRKIIPLCLPPHTTNLQPLGVAVFQPYNTLLKLSMQHDEPCILISTGLNPYRPSHESFKYTTIVFAFRGTGLTPEVALDADSESELEPPHTPRAVTCTESYPPTVLIVRPLKRHGNQLEAAPPEERSIPIFQ